MGFILCGKGNWSSPIQNLVQTESANEMAKADDENLFYTILKIKFKKSLTFEPTV